MNHFITVMKALPDPSRVKIIKMLEHRSMCVLYPYNKEFK